MIAVTLFPILSEPFDGANKYFILNETVHYEKCELLRVQDENVFLRLQRNLQKVSTKYFSKLSEFLILA